MAGFTAVDLSKLPAPDIVETLDYETIFGAMLAKLQALDEAFSALVESDPAYKILQVAAYRELILRQRVNDAARGVMLAYATGADLDNLGALLGTPRFRLDPGDPERGIAPTYESDTAFRRRITLAPEGYSVAGPEGAYIFHALNAHSDVLDASATSPPPEDIRAIVMKVLSDHQAAPSLVQAVSTALDSAAWPGQVIVSILSRQQDGQADDALIAAVAKALSAENVRPLTDRVSVQSARIVPYTVEATLYTYAGPDAAVVIQASTQRLHAYIKASHRIGRDITVSGIYSALHSEGVQRVELASPKADIVIDRRQAAYCTGITLNNGGVDE